MNDYHVFNGSAWMPAAEAYKHNGFTWEKVWPLGIPRVNILSLEQKDVEGVGYSVVVKWEKIPGPYVYRVGLRVGSPAQKVDLRDEEPGDTAALFVGRPDWFGQTIYVGVVAEDTRTGKWGEDIANMSTVVQQPVPGPILNPITVETVGTHPDKAVVKFSWTYAEWADYYEYQYGWSSGNWQPDRNTWHRADGPGATVELPFPGDSKGNALVDFNVRARNSRTYGPSNTSTRKAPVTIGVPQLNPPTAFHPKQVEGSRMVSLTWTAPVGPSPKRYGIRYGIAGGALEPDATITNDGSNAYTFPAATFEGVRNGERWNFNIQSLNGEGEPGYSGWAGYEGVTFSGLGNPEVPPGQPEIVRASYSNNSNIYVVYKPPTRGGIADNFTVSLMDQHGNSRDVQVSDHGSDPSTNLGGGMFRAQISTTKGGLQGSPLNSFWTVNLVGHNRYGDSKPATTWADNIQREPRSAPENVRAGSVTHDSVEVLWDPVEEAIGYAVLQHGADLIPLMSSEPRGEVTALEADTEHVFQVVALFEGAVSEGSEELAVRTEPASEGGTLPAPVVTLERNKPAWNKWQASWTAVEGASSYKLKWIGSTPEGKGHGEHVLMDLTALEYKYTGTDLAWNESVTCQVAAVDANGVEGEWSLPQDAV
ncbi:hypothetical protein ACFYYS_06235 [Streptomyces sp. NPDC002120]|uniref:hypothetical protein n=1 Tax=Streptomyces sp. NPDC002120 TaxID=3364631 RepID=UPI0036C39A80